MLILGIETSGSRGSIAVCRDEDCLADVELENAPRRHAQSLVSQIGELFRQLDLKIADLGAVAVSVGPGSFTGLRVGTVCARRSPTRRARLAAVDTFEAIAANSPSDADAVQVIADAQRGDLFVADYRRLPAGQWACVHPPSIVRAVDWFASLTVRDLVSGPGLQSYPPSGPIIWRCLPAQPGIPLLERSRKSAFARYILGGSRMSRRSNRFTSGGVPPRKRRIGVPRSRGIEDDRENALIGSATFQAI